LVLLSAGVSDGIPPEKLAVVRGNDTLLHYSNTAASEDDGAVVYGVTVTEEPEIVLHELRVLAGAFLAAGPLTWGITHESFYVLAHTHFMGDPQNYDSTRIGGEVAFIPDLLAREDARRRNAPEEEFDRIRERQDDHSQRYSVFVEPLVTYIKARSDRAAARRGEASLREEWNLAYDGVFIELDQTLVAAVHEGEFLVWELDRTDDPNNRNWTAREPVTTEMDRHFRILRAGDDLYFIDLDGIIFTGLDAQHRRIGSVPDWNADPENAVLMLEDQHQEKIAFLRVDDRGEIVLLPIKWDDNSHEGDFLQTIESPDLRAAIVRMAEIIEDGE